MDAVRDTLERLVRERGEDYASLSRLLGRNAAYVQQFIRRGTPRKLDEDDRRTLARYFGIDEGLLGGPASASAKRGTRRLVGIPRLDVLASAGPGGEAVGDRPTSWIEADPAWLKGLTPNGDAVSAITVKGDSMSPTLADGDDILVDRADAAARLRDGVYVLRIDDALAVKRLAIRPGGAFAILSDNPAYPPIDPKRGDRVDIIGRVIWVGRRLT